MREELGSLYSEAYDLLYQDKDYARECDLIECLSRDPDETTWKVLGLARET